MGIAELIALVLKLVGWIVDFGSAKKEQAKKLVDDIQHHAKQTSESVKKHTASTRQRLNLTLRRKEILKKRKKKDQSTWD